jgi:hypothetical protein
MNGWLGRLRRGGRSCWHLVLFGMVLLLLTQCRPEGDSTDLPPPSDTPSLEVER